MFKRGDLVVMGVESPHGYAYTQPGSFGVVEESDHYDKRYTDVRWLGLTCRDSFLLPLVLTVYTEGLVSMRDYIDTLPPDEREEFLLQVVKASVGGDDVQAR